MQQNVQSQRPIEAGAYSQQRNSNPSKIPDSQLIPNHRSVASFHQNPIQLQIHEPKHQQNYEQPDELKKIDQQIKKQRDLIEKLKLEKQQIENNMTKSYLSLSPNLLDPRNDDSIADHDDLLETKTQADLSFLENRKNVATKQLQTEQEKYRENIRKMQLKKSQMKRKLKQDPEIPIKVMDFKELERKKQSKEDEQPNIQNHQNQQQEKSLQKQENLDQIGQVIVQAQSKKLISQKSQENEQPIQQSQKSNHTTKKDDNIKEQQSQKNGSQLINHSKFSEKKSHVKVDEANRIENNSRVSQMNSNKKYSVKKSSVVVPEFNQSIKEIQERRQKQSQKVSSQKQSHFQHPHEINLEPDASHKSRSRVSSVKKSQAKESLCALEDSDKKYISEKPMKEEKSVKNSAISKEMEEMPEQSSKEVEVKSQKLENKEETVKEGASAKEKTSIKSKKSQKVELMYIPYAIKQPSHKSFKKTDKSIQWSEVDMSMYGKTNQIGQSHNNSQLLSQLNQQNPPLKQETEESRVSNQMEAPQINMKKNKTQDKILVEEGSSRRERVSEKVSNLAPLKSNKEKSLKQSIYSKASQSKGSFFAGSRQGSVKQKAERYDQFHREHSLNNKKVESKKLAMMQNLNSASGSKQPSYRSRKSNPISNLSAPKSKVESVVFNEAKANSKAGKSQVVKNQAYRLNQSKVLISKQQINLLHNQIQKLEDKLLNIQAKQQKLAREKEEELNKLQQIAVEEEKMAQEIQKSRIMTQHEQKDQLQNLLVGLLIPQQESVSKQLIKEDNVGEEKTKQEPTMEFNMQKSFISQKNNIQKQIDQIAQIQKKFNQEKSELMEEINKLRKTIRELQIQKIKSIDHNQTISSKDDKSKRPHTEIHEFGVIVHQNKMNRTIDSNMLGDQDESGTVPIGKIVKNQSPEKNTSRLVENFDSRAKSIDRKFRINMSKKSSVLSDHISGMQLDSGQISVKRIHDLGFEEQGNEQLQRKKKQFYPINAKEGYVVVSSQHHREQQIASQKNLPASKQEIKLPDISESKIRRAELTKDEILEKFHRTNRQFNNFIESSRIINETNSSISSHNNFFDKTHQSSAFSNKKGVNHEEEDNPQTTKLLNKMSDSNLELHKDPSKNQFQQSFTRIIENIKHEATQQNESDDELEQIEVRDVEMPQLSKTPDITYHQDQLMKLAQETFKIFGIEVSYDDSDFNMKKYKNCVIFIKGTETILWHYNGKFYIGGWKGKEDGSGEKTGYGVEIVPDKHIYKGQFMNGKKHGTGIMKSENGNIYDGQWIEGIKNGQGVYYDSTTKVVYSGEWKDGKKNGFGILKFSEKEYYKGTFVKSVKDGYGIQVFINGDKYKGEYRKGKFHGKGKYSWANTSSFEGDFCEGMRHGNGSWKSAKINGDIYVGAYKSDKKSGYGRYIWSNGCIYEGNFAQDVKHGKGRLIYTDGKQIKGIWEEGTLLEAVTQNPKEYNQEQVLKRGSKLKAR